MGRVIYERFRVTAVGTNGSTAVLYGRQRAVGEVLRVSRRQATRYVKQGRLVLEPGEPQATDVLVFGGRIHARRCHG
jgi:hypothetical protein